MAVTLVFLPGKSHEQRSLAGYSPWGHNESDTTLYVSVSDRAQEWFEARFRKISSILGS